jgi:hypothetical protein
MFPVYAIAQAFGVLDLNELSKLEKSRNLGEWFFFKGKSLV